MFLIARHAGSIVKQSHTSGRDFLGDRGVGFYFSVVTSICYHE